jgi:hypothetical protein
MVEEEGEEEAAAAAFIFCTDGFIVRMDSDERCMSETSVVKWREEDKLRIGGKPHDPTHPHNNRGSCSKRQWTGCEKSLDRLYVPSYT